MTEKPYTEADVELVARAEFDADQRHLVATSPNPAALEPTPWSLPILGQIRETYRNRARAVLDALAAAGRFATNGRCGEACPNQLTHGPRPVCALPAGHAGWHRGDDGCEWTGKPGGCPETVWDGPYAMRCSLGGKGGVCATHGRFRPAERED